MLLLFYFLFKIIKLVSVEKLCKSYTEPITDLFNSVQLRIHAFPIKDIVDRNSWHSRKFLKLVDGNITIIIALLENSDISDDELPFE